MKKINIIQSCYIFPEELSSLTLSHGFISAQFHWMSWCLSCLQLKEMYNEVILYTNAAGKEILIDKLKLPYSKVFINETNYPRKLWALNKIHTYSLQEEPFIHVDGDVFIWEKFNNNLINSPLIAQNIEVNNEFYGAILNEFTTNNISIPKEIIDNSNLNQVLKSCNAGIMGGNDLLFFKDYTQLAFSFTEYYQDKLLQIKNKDLNMVFEQLFFYNLAKKKQIQIQCVIPEEITNLNYPGIVNFFDVPNKTKFIHMLGSYKQSEEACKMLAKRLRLDFPYYYYNTVNEFKKTKLKLYFDIYNEKTIESNSLNKTPIDWNKIYEIQLKQQRLIDSVFINDLTFLETKFITNNFILSNNNIDPDLRAINVPCSLEVKLKQREVDELDILLIRTLETSKSVRIALDDLYQYFDPSVIENEKDDLTELIMIKLRRGCEDDIFHIIPNDD